EGLNNARVEYCLLTMHTKFCAKIKCLYCTWQNVAKCINSSLHTFIVLHKLLEWEGGYVIEQADWSKTSSQRGVFRKSTTYLAKIAVVLQDTPGKMLTFIQLMDKLAPLIYEERKSVENNIRVCLSTNKCFVKIPVVPDSLDSKRNYWKLDPSQITAKMVRRHFKGLLQLFPELASKVETENTSRPSELCSALHSPEPAACRAVQIRCEVKFSSPFSIESLLKRDSPSARPSRASPLSSVPVRVEQQTRPTHRLAILHHHALLSGHWESTLELHKQDWEQAVWKNVKRGVT
uniref:Fork-head domain-containing protein n=1 Tax=Cyclopterus lumpus TaxID=8103 RepID=A0A8C3GAW2_CYCLU